MQRRNRNMGAMEDRLKNLAEPLPEINPRYINKDLDEIDSFIRENFDRSNVQARQPDAMFLKEGIYGKTKDEVHTLDATGFGQSPIANAVDI